MLHRVSLRDMIQCKSGHLYFKEGIIAESLRGYNLLQCRSSSKIDGSSASVRQWT